jgi:hypothetical protein
LSNALSKNGILISQFGENVKFDSAGAQVSPRVTEYDFVEKLMDHNFTKIEDYAEGHGGFLGVVRFKVAFKCFYCNYYLWHSNQAMIDTEVRKRSMATVKERKEPLFRFFDGATMMGYQYPSRVVENAFCRDIPTPAFCEKSHGFDPNVNNIKLTSLEVKTSSIPNAGRGVFSKLDISRGSFLGLEDVSVNVVVMPTTLNWIQVFMKEAIVNRWRMFDAYLYGLGFESDFFGETCISIDNSILQFLNHGCNGTNNLQHYKVNEVTADLKALPWELSETFESTIYNPFVSRSHFNFQNCGDPTNRDIVAGDEILDTYLSYYTEETWFRGVSDLRAQCIEQSIGSVGAYDLESERTTGSISIE